MAGPNRRAFLKSGGLLAGAGTAGIAAFTPPLAGSALAAQKPALDLYSQMRGSISVTTGGMVPGVIEDQSVKFQKLLDQAATSNLPVFLPAGNYFVSSITLPKHTKLFGVPGSSRLIFSGNGHFIQANGVEHAEMQGIVFDGAGRTIGNEAEAAIRINGCNHLVIENCDVTASSATGIHAEQAAGRINHSRINGAIGSCAVYLVESQGMEVTNNVVSDCANGGILVHRWKQGEDGTIVTGNRVMRIGAAYGGTGQWGNGINVYRAGSVMVNNNQVTDCAFSAIRSNAGDNVQINNNTCLRSGETAIYSEFEFVGASINGNVIDGGARGISIANFMQGGRMATCNNNIVRNIVNTGPYREDNQPFGDAIGVEADATVNGNVIEGAAGWGISLGWGPYLRDAVVMGNVIRNARMGMYLSVVEGIGNVVITDNVFSGTKKGAVVGHHWKKVVTGDLLKGGAGKFKTLTIERNRSS